MAAQSLGSRRFRFNYGNLVASLLAIQICYVAKVHYEFVSDLTQDNIAKTHLPPPKNHEKKNGQQIEHEKQIFDGTRDGDQHNDTSDGPQKKVITYGLTIVHCKETKMDWLNDVPSDWKVKIYETCGQNVSRFSQQFKNAGSEECTAYLSAMIKGYQNDDLPDMNIFVQSDVLIGTGRYKPSGHSPFHNFSELVDAVTQLNEEGGGHFLHFGPNVLAPIANINTKLSYTDYYVRDIFNMMGLNYTTNSTSVRSRASACFAVTKDRILMNGVDNYIRLKDEILKQNVQQARKLCCGLENTWHAVLGEPYNLPETSTVDHLWKILEF